MNKDNFIHFIGINGIGMSGIARIFLNLGYEVSGSDLIMSDRMRKIAGEGGIVYESHNEANIHENTQLVVVSSAIPDTNCELAAARKRGIEIAHRSVALNMLMEMFDDSIAIAGAHGKTTTSSLVSYVLHSSGHKPTVVVGGEIHQIKSNAVLGDSKYIVVEADESDGSMINLHPKYVILTNIEEDHLDFYSDIEMIKKYFIQFLNNIPNDGLAILCSDCKNIRSILSELKCNVVTYGFSHSSDYSVSDIYGNDAGSSFIIKNREHVEIQCSTKLPGRHNVLNSLAVYTLLSEIGISQKNIVEGIGAFEGVKRRFQLICSFENLRIFDDYAHHPTEIKATLAAASQKKYKKLIAVFQPHRYSRTQALLNDFSGAFEFADEVLITEIYSAGEEKIDGVSGEILANKVAECHDNIKFFSKKEDIVRYLCNIAENNDLILTMGAGDVWKIAYDLSAKIVKERSGEIIHEEKEGKKKVEN